MRKEPTMARAKVRLRSDKGWRTNQAEPPISPSGVTYSNTTQVRPSPGQDRNRPESVSPLKTSTPISLKTDEPSLRQPGFEFVDLSRTHPKRHLSPATPAHGNAAIDLTLSPRPPTSASSACLPVAPREAEQFRRSSRPVRRIPQPDPRNACSRLGLGPAPQRPDRRSARE